METIETILLIFLVIGAVSMGVLILLQQGKGSDIGSAFGGGSSNTMFGPNSSLSPLAKITSVLALIFLVLSFYLTYQSRYVDNDITLEDKLIEIEEGVLPDTLPE